MSPNRDMIHILDYFNQNYDNLNRIVETEVDISIEKDGYILTGRIDLLLGNDGKLEILDFKTQQRPEEGDPILKKIYLQLCVYAHIVRERYGKNPARVYVYWTGERDRDTALMEFILNENDIKSSISYFDDVVDAIQKKQFEVKQPPDIKVCLECDFKNTVPARALSSLNKVRKSTFDVYMPISYV
ncbi:MAG TPA: PD-(D/E)XK nuclease family protein [Nitrososphaeraceae archaeon]